MSPTLAQEKPDNARSLPDPLPPLAVGVLIALCAAKLLLHLFTSVRHYGYFRDELYYLDLARHLDWGYVDCAPLIAVYAKIALLMGGSLAALRILPALAGAALIALTVLIAREFGGNRYAQFLAGLCILLCPSILVTDSLLTMNAFEPLYWMGCILVIARILRTGNSRLWIWFGVLAGLGLENKHSTLFFGFAVAVALLLTHHRREFAKPWIWIAFAIAIAAVSAQRYLGSAPSFPDHRRPGKCAARGKECCAGSAGIRQAADHCHGSDPAPGMVSRTDLAAARPEMARSWPDLCRILYHDGGLSRQGLLRLPDVSHVVCRRRCAIAGWLANRAAWTRAAVVAVMVLATAPLIPMATWMLPPERLLAYQNAIGFKPAKQEVHMESLLMQPIADQFGWPELVQQVAAIYNSLPPDERAQTGIWAGNYGEAGAINQFGPQYGLPTAYSRHQNHWYWGPPPQVYKNLIVIEWGLDDVQDSCTSYQEFDRYNRFAMGEENSPIYLCRGVKFDIQKIWWHSHHWN